MTIGADIEAFLAGIDTPEHLEVIAQATTAVVTDQVLADGSILRFVYVPAGADDPSKPDTAAITAKRLAEARAYLAAAEAAHAATGGS